MALHDIGKVPWVHEVINLARKSIKFILNHRLTLSIFRNIATQNLLRPVDTRFATHYIALKRLVEQKNALTSLVCNLKWTKNILAKGEHGNFLENTMFSQSFWLSPDKIVSICETIVKV